jgi:hypothetical protein
VEDKIPITPAVLKELEKQAVVTAVKGIDKLTYTNAQQAMVINSLINWLASYGIDAPFKLEL